MPLLVVVVGTRRAREGAPPGAEAHKALVRPFMSSKVTRSFFINKLQVAVCACGIDSLRLRCQCQWRPLSGWLECRLKFKHSSNPQLAKYYILVGLELPPSQRSPGPRQGREAELSPLQGAQKRPCSRFKHSSNPQLAKYILVGPELKFKHSSNPQLP
jgi:hypothetical protein